MQRYKGRHDDDFRVTLRCQEGGRALPARLPPLVDRMYASSQEDEPESESTVLFAHDMHERNILVNEGGDLLAILDWEFVSTVPIWQACRVPSFLEPVHEHDEPPEKDHYPPYETLGDWVRSEDVEDDGIVSSRYWEHLA